MRATRDAVLAPLAAVVVAVAGMLVIDGTSGALRADRIEHDVAIAAMRANDLRQWTATGDDGQARVSGDGVLVAMGALAPDSPVRGHASVVTRGTESVEVVFHGLDRDACRRLAPGLPGRWTGPGGPADVRLSSGDCDAAPDLVATARTF